MRPFTAVLATVLILEVISASSERTHLPIDQVPENIYVNTQQEVAKFSASRDLTNSEDQIEIINFSLTIKHLNSFFGTLISHLSWKGFDFTYFESADSFLQNQLENIEKHASKFNNTFLSNRLNVIRLIFQDMKLALALYKLFPSAESPENFLLSEVASLNVNLHMLRDSDGNPDRLLEGYTILLKTLSQKLESWDTRFDLLGDVSPALGLAFKRQVFQAYHTLEEFSEGFRS